MTDCPRSPNVVLQALRVAVVGTEEAWETEFLRAACPNGARESTVQIAGQAVDVRMTQRPENDDEVVDGAVLLLHYLDGNSLRTIGGRMDGFLRSRTVPTTAVLLREEEEAEFKISCCSCGQKLWVRDADEGKRGRCPNCRKAFVLPSQESYLRSMLRLPENAPVLRARRGDVQAARSALPDLLSYIAEASPIDADASAESGDPTHFIPEVPKTDTDVVEPI